MQNNKADIMFVVLCYVLLFFCLFVFSFINEGIPFLQQTANLSDVNFDVCGIKMAGCVQDEVRLFIPRKRKAKTVYLGANFCYLSLNSRDTIWHFTGQTHLFRHSFSHTISRKNNLMPSIIVLLIQIWQ